ncbi:MAG: galactokinase [Burkholderiales bacterium]|nr:galactokinase [Burkholderiales bacterium]MDE1928152.1 galactokinase [Burkholderiales bacterium]MDE2158364.1 galactokinase [Burkholderiales bacterium]
MQARVLGQFRASHGGAPALVVQAPGRVNLIGEHTDYNDGYVLPCAIGYRTLVAARPRADTLVRVAAADCGGAVDSFDLADDPLPHAAAPWADYVRGMAWAMRDAGHALRGADLAIAGDVPQGSGLSSSASLQVAVGQAFKSLQGLDALDPTALARLAQRAENDFVGCRCGIMDQLISARGVAGHALLIDCRSLEATPVPLPRDVAVLIVESRISRGLVDSEYNRRREQCEAAARHCSVAALRDLDLASLEAGAAGLEATTLRRARHVVTENARTLAAAQALAAGDLDRVGRLMAASHASMRDDFEITLPAIDRLVDILANTIGTAGGARMTGGGFGGCVVALLPEERVEAARAAVQAQYRSPAGEPARVHLCRAGAGAGLV